LADSVRSGQGADLLALGFGSTVAMWACGYICRLPAGAGDRPGVLVPGAALAVLMLACLLVGGWLCGRLTARGWRGGVLVGLIAGLLNLLILGSLLAGPDPSHIRPSALLWIPGSFLVGAVLGGLGAWLGQITKGSAGVSPANLGVVGVSPANWPAAFAGVAVAATLLLLAAGGVVTGARAGLDVPDWPNSFRYNMFLFPLARMTGGIYFEHAHRLFGSLVGLTTLTLAIYLQLSEQRRWVRRTAWLAFGVVVVQGLLGGLRVTGRLTLATEGNTPSIILAIVHGVFGQLFFGLLVAVYAFLSTSWRDCPQQRSAPAAGTDRFLTIVLVIALFAQLILGALLRHVTWGLSAHITFAVVVLLVAVGVGARAWGLYPDVPALLRAGRWLLTLIIAQVVLGILALAASGTESPDVRPGSPQVILTTAHQTVGALLLGVAVLLLVWNRRFLTSAPETAPQERETSLSPMSHPATPEPQ